MSAITGLRYVSFSNEADTRIFEARQALGPYPSLETTQNLRTLIASAADAESVAMVLAELNKANPDLLTQENFDVCIANREHVKVLARSLSKLNTVQLVTQENFNVLAASGKYAEDVAWGLNVLNDVDPDLLTLENLNALVASGENAEDVAWGLNRLKEVNRVTQDNFDALVRSGANANALSRALYRLARVGLLTQINFNLLFDEDLLGNKQPILSVDAKLPDALTQETFDAFISSLLEKKWRPDGPSQTAYAAAVDEK